jgi:hypothetical protein
MRNNAWVYLVLFLFLGGAWTGCFGCFGSNDAPASTESDEADRDGGEDDDDEADDPAENLADAMKQAQNAMKDAFSGGDVKESVDFRKLRDVLPGDFGGMDRTNAEGQRNRFMGMEMSQAEATYEDGDGSVKITIVDLGTLTELARMGYAAWLSTEIDRESDRGFERTGTFEAGGEEYAYYEKFESTDGDVGTCEVKLWVAERFVVDIEGRQVKMRQCQDARDEVDYDELDEMKTDGMAEE